MKQSFRGVSAERGPADGDTPGTRKVAPSGYPPVRAGRRGFRSALVTFVLVNSLLAASSFATPASAIPAPTTAPVAAVRPSLAAPTSWQALNRAIAKIPRYRTGVATWRTSSTGAYYGATNLDTRLVYISRKVPSSRLYSVVAHEYAHALTVKNYAGSRTKLNAGLKKYFGSSGPVLNREYAADCMARLMGATWTYYTKCTSSRWRAASATLLKGRRL